MGTLVRTSFVKRTTMITKIAIFCIIGAAYAAPEAKLFGQYGIAECKFPDGNSAIYISEFVDDTKIFGHMYGLTDGLHAWHVHEFGDLGDGLKLLVVILILIRQKMKLELLLEI